MVKVDNIGMAVSQGSMPVRMTVRLQSLPALMYMPMVLVGNMQVPVLHRRVHVLRLAGITRRP